ncbi:MAG TPA: phosphomannomutase/phosphoglucomutase [Candidatus Peribacterales bacterium]|nr:phosphomannomutase/phosphoglucomutase [Candidatus Peribacterales bacterium]
MTIVPPHIFRSYDIRGRAESEVSEECCMLVGKAFGTELRERYKKDHPTVIVGRDARTHSPLLEAALIKGLVSTGCSVKTIGQVPSPVNYFALCYFSYDGSVQITASHNQKEDNGLKLQLRNAEAFAGEDLQHLRKRIEEERFMEGAGVTEEIDAVSVYKEAVKMLVARHAERSDVSRSETERSRSTSQPKETASKIARSASTASIASLSDALDFAQHDVQKTPLRGLKIVVDFGNGVAGPVYGAVLKEFGIDVISLYADPDGTFPNHIADPSNHKTLNDLIATVKKEKADLGMAFDGDGDRIGIVDERGVIVSADSLLLLLAEDHLQRHKGAPIIYTVSMSSIIETEVKRLGGKPVMCIVGHSFVEHAMKEHGSHLGAEQSGHFFCGEDFYDHDDALVAAVRILSILAQQSSKPLNLRTFKPQPKPEPEPQPPLSSLLSRYPAVFLSPEWRPHCDDDKKSDVIRRITRYFQAEGYPCITIDGVRIDFGEGAWAGIRQSNTSPKLSVCMEARSQEKLSAIEYIVRAHMKTYQEIGE